MPSTYEKKLRAMAAKPARPVFVSSEPYQIVPFNQWYTIVGPDGMLMGFVPAKNPRRYSAIVSALNAAYAKGKADSTLS
jgi:hypothetical protein